MPTRVKAYLNPRTCLTSPGVSFHATPPLFAPQMSAISATASKLSTVAICVNLENLSLIVQVVTLVRKETRDLTSRSNSNPPSRLNLLSSLGMKQSILDSERG